MIYLTYEGLLALHVSLMRDVMGETFYGVLYEGLLRSALARPRHAAQYENASPLRQAAYLFHGLLMNHGFAQGNKRSAYTAMEWFIRKNGLGAVTATNREVIDMCYSAENDKWDVDRIEAWLVQHCRSKD